MVWSFLWRFVVYGAAFAYGSTYVLGFVMGMFGSNAQAVHEAGRVVQLAALFLGALAAWAGAKESRTA